MPEGNRCKTSSLFLGPLWQCLDDQFNLSRMATETQSNNGNTMSVNNIICGQCAMSSNICVISLLPNCTSRLEPLDQGIIWSVKCNFGKILLNYVMSGIENEVTSNIINISTSFLKCFFIRRVWSDVHPDVILNGFKKAGFACNAVMESTNHD